MTNFLDMEAIRKMKNHRKLRMAIVLIAAFSFPMAPIAKADWVTDLAERAAINALLGMAKNQSLMHLQNRSVAAIENVKYARGIGQRQADFDNILAFAALTALFSRTVYNKPTNCRSASTNLQSVISGQSISGPGGVYATVYRVSFPPGRPYPLPAEFPRPKGWGTNDPTKAYEAVFVSFRGTEIFSGKDWLTNLYAGLGGAPAQYRWAINLATTVLNQFPNDRLVIFTGHSLGGALATYAALAFRVGAITFNSAGLHPNNFRSAVLFDPSNAWRSDNLHYNPTIPQPVGFRLPIPKDLNSISPVEITNIYHFISHSTEGITDLISNVSFAGYSILAGGKYFINTDYPFGTKPVVRRYMDLHSVEILCGKLHALNIAGTGSTNMSKKQLHGRAIYSHP